MRALAAAVVMALAASVPGAMAQSDSNQQNATASSSLHNAGEQLKEGARRFGHGIKDGAVGVWEAVKSGAQTVGEKLRGQDKPGKTRNSAAAGAGEQR